MPPPIPDRPLVAAAGTTAVAVSWRKVHNVQPGNQGPMNYVVFRNGVQVLITRESDINDTNLADGNTYTYAVSSRDNSGTSAQSPSASVTLPVAVLASYNDGWLRVGLGDPNNRVFGSVGMQWVRTDGVNGSTFYVKEVGGDSRVGWIAK
jgi:hypothetical protein